MAKNINWQQKLNSFKEQTLFKLLAEDEKRFLEELFFTFHFSFQEFLQLTNTARDFEMWGQASLSQWIKNQVLPTLEKAPGRTPREKFFSVFNARLHELKSKPKSYDGFKGAVPKAIHPTKLIDQVSAKNIFGWCPVASEKTVCCNLRTIDAVETCSYGCSYCTIQTFYSNRVVFEADLKSKLEKIEIDPARLLHIGTGQSSDSLVWGNRNGMLDDLFDFARKHPNVLLELKTKSANVSYFLENDVPPNVVCTWSLNPQIIIDNEEHFTASLTNRLKAAKKVADRGVKVGFHFHPMIYYDQWADAYPAIARQIMDSFEPNSVLFISMGSVTMIRPVIKQIRKKGFKTRILQMELVPDPHGKWTYPDEIKVQMFKTMYRAFAHWHQKVFFYLCMEKADIWLKSFGFVFQNNEEFEEALLKSSFEKIGFPEQITA
ncbi:SPL family radical SAM protein [Calditrichota bacterium LG25]